jgi:hypothetical protein
LIAQAANTYPLPREEGGETRWRKMPRYRDKNGCSG